MKSTLLRILLFGFFSTTLFSCKTDKKDDPTLKKKENSIVEYAKGFDIIKDGQQTKIIINTPYPNSKETFTYVLGKEADITPPIKRVVVTSTTHIPILELLDKEQTLVGFPHTKYISSEKTRALIAKGSVAEIGKEASLNTEVLLDLQPDIVIGFSMGKINKTLATVEQSGIPILINGDWLEETPLGRAEWIKVFGVLYKEEKKADSIFNSIKTNYLNAAKIAQKATTKPTVLSGAIMSKDVWNLPAGQSFVAQFLKDANLDYLWKNTKGKGSLSLSYESVLEKGKDAVFWISPGHFTTKKQLLESNQHYATFSAFKNNQVYSPAIKKGKTGGSIYYELAPTRPDLVLKDIIKITHPELLPNYELTFFEKMN